MNIKRIGRMLVCLLLVCCLILNIAPPKAEATGAGLAATIVGASSVSVAAPLAVGAGLIALGVMASDVNPLVFENVVNDAVDSLSAAGNWVKDGTVELLQTIDSAGQKAYYVAGDMLDNLRSWIFDTSIIVENSFLAADSGTFTITDSSGNVISYTVDFSGPASLVAVNSSSYGSKYTTVYCISSGDSVSWDLYSDNELSDSGSTSYSESYGGYYKSITKVNRSSYTVSGIPFSTLTDAISGVSSGPYITSSDLTLGHLPSHDETLTDTTVVTFHPYFTNLIRTKYGGSGNNGNGKNWWVGVGLVASVAALATKTQQQVIEDPQVEEIPDLTTNVEFRIEYETEVETNPDTGEESKKDIIVLNPVEVPGTGGSGSDATIPTTEEIPELLKGLWADIKTSFSDLPNKFSNWFDAIIEWLRKIWESIQTIVSSLLEGLRQLLIELFAPSEDFIATKVNSLIEKYPYLDTFLALGADLKLFFLSLGTKPPVIYIDLGAATGSYNWGGSMAFLDLTWYSQYKPAMDNVLGAFIWLWLAWRAFLSLPGLINGASGAAGSVIRYGERSTKSNDGGADK